MLINKKNIIHSTKILIIVIILVFISFYLYFINNLEYIRNNWNDLKCIPYYSPFAGFVKKKKNETIISAGINNMSRCLWAIIKRFFTILIKPLQYILKIIVNLINHIKDILQKFREQLIVIRKILLEIVVKVMKRLEDLLSMFLFTFLKLRDTTKKSMATFKLMTFMLQTSSLTLQSLVNGPVGKLARLAGKYGYLMTYFLLGPMSLKMFPSLWLPILCFDNKTKIILDNGNDIEIEKIRIGDSIKKGGKVIGIQIFLNLTQQHIFNIDNDLVSGNHIIWKDLKWKYVKNINSKINTLKSPLILRNLSTENNLICTKNNIYRDWEETNNISFLLTCKNKILNILNNCSSILWSKSHLYNEGFKFLNPNLDLFIKTKLGYSYENNYIIGKTIHLDKNIIWYKLKNKPCDYLVSGSNIVYNKLLKRWEPIYLNKNYIQYNTNKINSISYHFVTLTGTINIRGNIYKDYLEIRSKEYDLFYEKNIFNII